MITWIVSSSALIVIVLVLRQLLKSRICKRWQYALWLAVLIRLLIPFNFGEWSVSLATVVESVQKTVATSSAVQTPTAPAVPQPSPTTPAAPSVNDTPPVVVSPVEPITPSVPETPSAPAPSPAPVTLPLLPTVWVTGMVIVGVWLVACNVTFALRLKRTRTPVDTFRGRRVYVSHVLVTPCLHGLFRPAVYVTSQAAKNRTTYLHTLEHEWTHYRHGDLYWSLLRGVALVLHWYNPLVWVAAILSRRDAELCCDESTLARLGDGERTAYGETLLWMTSQKAYPHTLLGTATTMASPLPDLKERLLSVVKRSRPTAWAAVVTAAVMLFATFFTMSGAAKKPKPRRLPTVYGNTFTLKDYFEYSTVQFTATTLRKDTFTERYEPTYIPEGYTVTSRNINNNIHHVVFEDEAGNLIVYSQRWADIAVNINTEHGGYEVVSVGENEGVVYRTFESTNVIFSDGTYTYTVSLSSRDAKEELLRIARSLRPLSETLPATGTSAIIPTEPQYIPEGFVLESKKIADFYSKYYFKSDHAYISYSQDEGGGGRGVSTEGCSCEIVSINGHEGILWSSIGGLILLFSDTVYEYMLTTNYCSLREELLHMARSIPTFKGVSSTVTSTVTTTEPVTTTAVPTVNTTTTTTHAPTTTTQNRATFPTWTSTTRTYPNLYNPMPSGEGYSFLDDPIYNSPLDPMPKYSPPTFYALTWG